MTISINPATGELIISLASTAVTSVAGRAGAVVLTKADVGLSNVDNTSDANKPVSIATATALGLKADSSAVTTSLASKADLVSGVIPTSQIPAIAISDFLGTVASQAAMLALTGQKGDWAIRSDTGATWIISGADPTQLSSWTSVSYPGAPVTSVNGQTGAVTLSAANVGAQTASATLTTWAGITPGTGVAAALAVNVGTAGAFVVNGGALGTPASGTLTNCTFPTLNQSTSGSAASLSVSGQSGLITFTGLASTNRIKTVRDAADTILELGGSYTPTGTWTNLQLAGNPTAPTAAANASTTQLATTAFVMGQAGNKQTTTLGSAQASITFTVPAGFTNLRLTLQGRGDTAAATTVSVGLQFNADAGSNYDWGRMYYASGTGGSELHATDKIFAGLITTSTNTAGSSGQFTVFINNYSGTTFYKTVRSANVLWESSSLTDLFETAGIWRSTSAITSITLTPAAGNFVAGTVATLIAE